MLVKGDKAILVLDNKNISKLVGPGVNITIPSSMEEIKAPFFETTSTPK